MSIAMPVVDEQVEQARFTEPRQAATGGKRVQAPSPSDNGEFRTSVNGNGRLHVDNLPQADRHMGVAVHLTPFAGFFFMPAFLVPLVLWLVRKDKSTFIDDHGKEMVNVLITGLLIFVVGTVAGFLTLGLAWIAALVWYIVTGINMIRAAIAANNGEYFRYPMTFRILS